MDFFQEANSSIEVFEKAKEFYDKYKGRPVTIIIPLIFCLIIFLIFPNCFGKIKIKNTMIDVNWIIKGFLFIIIFFVWFIVLILDCHRLKNNTVRYGIGLIFMDSIGNSSLSRKRLIKHLKEEMKEHFEIKEYNKTNLKKYLKKDGTLKKNTSKKLNLWAIIKVSEEKSGVNNQSSYILTIVDHDFSVHVSDKRYENEILSNLDYDISNVLKEKYIISDCNSYNDSIDNSIILHIELNYILAITLIVSKNPSEAFPILNYILNQLINCKNVTPEIDYIFRNIVTRLLEAVGNSIGVIDKKDKMTAEDFDDLRLLCDSFYEIYNSPNLNNYVDKNEFSNLYPLVVLCKAVDFFYEGSFDEIENCLNTCYYNYDPHVYFFKFLKEAVNGNYNSAFSLIKKVKFRRDLDDDTIYYMTEFVNSWNYREQSEASLFCLALINKYFGDYNLYKMIRTKLLKDNDELGRYLKIKKSHLS